MQKIQNIKELTDSAWKPAQFKKAAAQIYWEMLQESNSLRRGNFARIDTRDIEGLFDRYDEKFFQGCLRDALSSLSHPLTFRLSGRMTRAGGKTTREESWQGRRLLTRNYEIAISTTLLFQTFKEDQSRAIVTGVPCMDRLQALQRIMEHEIIHLVEMMVWYHSDCFRNRFKSITARLFGHTESTHQLTTVDQRAMEQFGIQPGDIVGFQHDRQWLTGQVNRITKRATVLVENAKGELFDDGKHYLTFYVPIQGLRPLNRRTAS
jgi:hypothetical protein